MSINDRQKKEANSKYFDLGLNAKLSVLSSATQTTVYSIDEKKYFSLSDTMQKLIGQGILDHPYFDEYDIEEKATNQRDWKQFSEKLV